MHETSKSLFSKLADARYATRWLVGDGIDIGAGPDPLGAYAELFPLMRSCRAWDLADGDAETLAGVRDGTFDFVHSSHCLEHMIDPKRALRSWIRVLKPGGHLLVLVPDEDLYEQGTFPSRFNEDHKHTFTISKASSWSPKSVNVLQLLTSLSAEISPLRVELRDAAFLSSDPGARTPKGRDQTLGPVGECAIEIVARKRG